MKIRFDTHLHTDFSTDSKTPLEDHLARAEELALRGICITDHMDYDFPPSASSHPEDATPFCFDWGSYVRQIREAARNTEISVCTGVECGLQKTENVVRKNEDLCSRPELDYMIGSLHLVDGADPYYPSFWEDKDPAAGIRRYFEDLYENLLLFHNFDTLGHLDYIVRYAPSGFLYEPQEYRDIIDPILCFLVRKDIALEINTSGFKTDGRCQNPHAAILEWYHERGGELITVGSDAHTPDFLAHRFDSVAQLLKKTGMCQYAVYRKHKPVFYDF